MVAFIDDHQEAYGFEPICTVLPIASRPTMAKRLAAQSRGAIGPSAVHTRRTVGRSLGIAPPQLFTRLLRTIDGALFRREGITVARCTVDRLMPPRGPARGGPWGDATIGLDFAGDAYNNRSSGNTFRRLSSHGETIDARAGWNVVDGAQVPLPAAMAF